MDVSIIIPTYNGANKISSIVRALEDQTFRKFEVIVVVDGSTDNTSDILKSLSPDLFAYKIIEQENRGRAAVRNNGAKNAQGKLLIFFDDDMLPLPDCIEEHYLFHQKHENAIVTGGLKENPDASATDIHQFRVYLSEKWTSELKRSSGSIIKKENIFLTAANFSITKDLFMKLGGFDEMLSDAEDFDLAVRAFKENLNLYYHQPAFAWHNDVVTGANYIVRLRQYQKAQVILRKIKPELYSDFSQYAVIRPEGVKKSFFTLFANKYWIRQLDKDSWLQMLPIKLRYKIYDYIITANGVFFPEKVQIA